MIELKNLYVAKQRSSKAAKFQSRQAFFPLFLFFAALLLCDQKILLLNKPETGLK
jgi:hypothetical protein